MSRTRECFGGWSVTSQQCGDCGEYVNCRREALIAKGASRVPPAEPPAKKCPACGEEHAGIRAWTDLPNRLYLKVQAGSMETVAHTAQVLALQIGDLMNTVQCLRRQRRAETRRAEAALQGRLEAERLLAAADARLHKVRSVVNVLTGNGQ